jgi:membrane-bound ClpP family serine protease
MRGRLGAAGLWGVAGVVAILVKAIIQLTPVALSAYDHPFTTLHRIALVVWVAFMVYSEGYRAFHKAFSPRVVSRAQYLAAHPRPLHVAFAPLYCMGLFHATKKRLIVSWSVTLGVVGIVLLVRELDQPWRGIVDGGVILGLSAGTLSILYYAIGQDPPVPPDVPE